MTVGQKVPGYGILNEYGEFEFTPQAIGSRKGRIKVIKETQVYSVQESRNLVIVHLRLPKFKGLKLIQELMNAVNELIQVFRTYEI